MPSSLVQRYVVSDEATKPLHLLLLLHYLVFYHKLSQAPPRQSSCLVPVEGAGSETDDTRRGAPADLEREEEEERSAEARPMETVCGGEGEEEEEEEEAEKRSERKEERSAGEASPRQEEGERAKTKKKDKKKEQDGDSGKAPREKKIRAIIFCRSRDETHRLCRLLQLHFEKRDREALDE